MGDAEKDQARLFAAGNHLDRKAERRLGLFQESFGILRHAQGIGGHRAHGALVKVAQAFGKARQRFDAALLGGRIEPLVGRQARREPDRLLESVEGINLVGHDPPHLQPKAVGAEIDRGDQFVGHVAILPRAKSLAPVMLRSQN